MAITNLMLDPDSGSPEVQVIFGQAQIGIYDCYLWDENAQNAQLISRGNNFDNIEDVFTVPESAADLKGRYLSWQVAIQTATSAPGQLYSLTVIVRQGGVTLEHGVLQHLGQFDSNSKAVLVYARFL